ncbi:unnamed protein product [Chrysoparadoxa australica]
MSELSHAPPNLMCSEEEATRREEEMDVSMYEATDATLSLPVNKRRIDRRRAVAKYRRSAAGRDIQAEAFQRPLPALLDTTRYLLTLFMRETGLGCKQPRVGGSTHDAYTFVEDRLRAVRQSLVVQHMSHKEDAILILEATARFYILSGHLLQNASVLEQPQPFDSHLLQSQLNGVMASLTEQHQAGKGSIDEFSCYRMLLSLGQAVRGDHHSGSAAATLGLCCSQSAAGVGSLSQLLRSIVVSYEGGALDSPRMTFALRCVTSCLQGNYRQFLQGLKEATPLENCLLTTIAESTRVHCLLCVNKGFGKGEKVPIVGATFTRVLFFFNLQLITHQGPPPSPPGGHEKAPVTGQCDSCRELLLGLLFVASRWSSFNEDRTSPAAT